MALPIWAQQVWANQPDVQAIIATQQAAAQKNAQLALAGVQVQLEQQKLQSDQRQFQESMALKQQEMKSKAAAQAWEMQLAEKRATSEALVAEASAARYDALTAKYLSEAQPGGGAQRFPAFGEQPTQTATPAAPQGDSRESGFAGPQQLPFQPGVTPFSDPNKTPFAGALADAQPANQTAGAGTVLQSPTPAADLLSLSTQQPQAQTEAARGFNTLTGGAGTTAPALATQTKDDYADLKIGESRELGDGVAVKKVGNGEIMYGTIVKGDWKWSSARPSVSSTAQTAEQKAAEKAAETKATTNFIVTKTEKAGDGVMALLPEGFIGKVARGEIPNDLALKELNAKETRFSEMQKTAARTAETLRKADLYEQKTQKSEYAAALKSSINLKIGKLAALSKTYTELSKNAFLTPGEQERLTAKYEADIAEPKRELEKQEAILEEKLNSVLGASSAPQVTAPAASAAPVATASTISVADRYLNAAREKLKK